MRKEWKEPEIQNLSFENTSENPTPYDPGHLDPERPHYHHCSDCSLEFETQAEAVNHMNKYPGHHIGCHIIS